MKVLRNTVVIFYSDNGTDSRIRSRTSGGIVQGGKGFTTANGIHVPLIASWPGRIPGGAVISDLVDSTDFLPTIAELGGVTMPADWKPDGVSFAPRLFGEPGQPREWAFFWHDPRPGWDKEYRTRHIFALTHRFKLYSDGRFFDLGKDPTELSPLPAAQLSSPQRAIHDKLKTVISRQLQDFPDRR